VTTPSAVKAQESSFCTTYIDNLSFHLRKLLALTWLQTEIANIQDKSD
jgi:hypothetical protein